MVTPWGENNFWRSVMIYTHLYFSWDLSSIFLLLHYIGFEFIVDDVWKHSWMNGFHHIMRADIYRAVAKAPGVFCGQWLKRISSFLFRIMNNWNIFKSLECELINYKMGLEYLICNGFSWILSWPTKFVKYWCIRLNPALKRSFQWCGVNCVKYVP